MSGKKTNQASITIGQLAGDLFNRPRKFGDGEDFYWGDKDDGRGAEAEAVFEEKLLEWEEKASEGDDEAQEATEAALDVLKSMPTREGSASDFGEGLAAAAFIARFDLGKGDGKGTTSNGSPGGKKLRDIIKNMCSDYVYLRAHALRLGQLTESKRDMHPCGTTSNESLHKELASWGQLVNRQGPELADSKLTVFLWLKLSAFILRAFFSRRLSQAGTVQLISALFRRDEDPLLLEHIDDNEYKRRQLARAKVISREALVLAARKKKREKDCAARGIRYFPEVRGDQRRIRTKRRQRGFQRAQNIPRSGTVNAKKCRRWRSDLKKDKDRSPRKRNPPPKTPAIKAGQQSTDASNTTATIINNAAEFIGPSDAPVVKRRAQADPQLEVARREAKRKADAKRQAEKRKLKKIALEKNRVYVEKSRAKMKTKKGGPGKKKSK